ncbi:MAG: murein L,D-transpeptidase catalytic domain family protein [Bdellovibrionales bacterium]|nr:murein L,D-transpeptidase catalytic domain family protein [Bdellovibrionales bacterium]
MLRLLALLPLFISPAFASPLASLPDGQYSNSSGSVLAELTPLAPRLSGRVLKTAYNTSRCAVARHLSKPARYLGVIDYTLPSTEKRFWMFDVHYRKLLFEELVAHGKNTGENYARSFSNTLGSLQSSLGLFRTGETYLGKNGYSLRLHGLETGINDLAFDRTIVMHGAPYVNEEFIQEHGRLGRSWGCPALRPEVTQKVLRLFEDNGFLFIYHAESEWEAESPLKPLCQ